MAETLDRAHLALPTAAITDASCVAYTATSTCTAYVAISNVDGTNDVDIDIAVDVGGTGAVIRYVAGKNTPVPKRASFSPMTVVLLTGDKLRARASAAGDAELYANIVKS